MKIKYILIIGVGLLLGVLTNSSFSQTAKTVGSGGDYSNLKAAFDAINAGSVTGSITLQIISSTTESSSPSLNASGTGSANYSSVLIYPTGSGFSISNSGNVENLIQFTGADNVTIDGRVSQSGSTDLTITNTYVSDNSRTIAFLNDASNNIIKYCNIKGSPSGTGRGIIHFSTSNQSTGNDNNTIDYCNITNAGSRPMYAIYSIGSYGKDNSGNVISNNNIYDVLSPSFSNSYALFLAGSSTEFVISGNSFYEKAGFEPTSGNNYNTIRVLSNTNNTISGNYIGGRAPQCGGDKWTVSANLPHYFCAIMVSGATSGAALVSNNIISNMDYTSTQSNPWDGIFIHAGNVNVYGNTIGATTGNNSIIVRTPCASASATLSGGVVQSVILNGGGSGYTSAPVVTFSTSGSTSSAVATANLTDGVVTSITLVSGGSGYTAVPSVYFDAGTYSTSHGMINNSSGTVNISNNNTGSITTVGNDYYSHGFESIYVRSGPSYTTISNNLYGSLTTSNSLQTSSSAASSLIKQDIYGIYSANTGTTIISGNTVANLTNNYSGTNTGTRTRGIQTIYGTNTIQNNTVRDITTSSKQNPFGSNASLAGISQTSTTANQTVTGNTVYSLSNLTSGSNKIEIYGIYYAGPTTGTNTITGNFIHSLSTASTNTGCFIDGILLNGGTVTTANNIINIGKEINTGFNLNGIYEEQGTNSIYFNTVYIGGSSVSGTTNNTYALLSKQSNTTRNIRNNIFNNSRSGGSGGYHYAIRIGGTTNLTIDYNDYFVNGTGGILGYLAANKSSLEEWKTATGQDAYSININPNFSSAGGTMPQNYFTSESMNGVSISGFSADFFGTIRGETPKIGALEGSSGYVWVGSISNDFATAGNWVGGIVPPADADISFSTTPLNHCVLDNNRSLGNITISEGTYKLVLNGKQLTIKGNLNFTNGAQIDGTSSSSSVVFQGTSAQTISSANFLNNTISSLTLDNSSGLNLNSDLSVTSTTTLTDGTLTLGAYSLTIYNLSTGSGNINAINSGSTLIFSNNTAITLPAFLTNINNLTINGTGGLTASSDMTVNGVLNLAAANPSATKGSLDMGSYTLDMGVSSTTTGTGDVEGIVKREHTFAIETIYTFGSQYTTFYFVDANTKPQWIICKITIGAIPGWGTLGGWDTVRGKVSRYYNVAVSNNSSTSVAAINMRYLASELDATFNTESRLVFWHKFSSYLGGIPHEHGKSFQDTVNHILGVTGIIFGAAAKENPDSSEVAIAYSNSTKNTWKGEVSGHQTEWGQTQNWSYGTVPTSETDVLIPAGLTYYPSLTDSVCAKSIEILSGASLTANSHRIRISGSGGAWINNGTFNAGTGKVLFYHGVLSDIVTVSGTTNFYDIECGANTTMQPVAGCMLRIAGTGTAYESSVVDFSTINNTVEYNGSAQNIVNPNGIGGHSGYYNLILSGSGKKTMPNTSMTINGNFTMSGSIDSVTAMQSLTINGNLIISEGLIFNTGDFNHSIGGNFENNGTFTHTEDETITFNGTSEQSILGISKTNFQNLTINNANGVILYSAADINKTLTLTAGNFDIEENILGINGTISKTNGYIKANTYSSINFGGNGNLQLPENLFTSEPTLNNITLNKDNGSVTLSQNMIINSALTLTKGLLILGNYDLSIGSMGTIDGTPSATNMVVANSNGKLFKNIADSKSQTFSFVYPVGDTIGTDEYSPVSLNFGSGTYSNAYAGVNVINSKHPDNTSTLSYLNRYWDVEYSGISDFTCNATFQYLPEDVAGTVHNELDIFCGMYEGGVWKLLNRANAETHQLTGSVTSFNAFTGGQESALPVSLSSLTSTVIGRNIKLNWTTIFEMNNSGFDVERKSLNGNWAKVGFVNGKGTVNMQTEYTYEDRFLNTGKYSYRLKQIDFNGNFEYFNLENQVEVGVPAKFDLGQNYPNPFNPVTKINYELPIESKVRILIYDILGREVKTIINENMSAGYYTVQFDASGIASGVYFYRIIAKGNNNNEFISTKKMVVLK